MKVNEALRFIDQKTRHHLNGMFYHSYIRVVSLTNLSVDLFPDIELPVAVTIFNYEGVGPEEIEQIITEPVEGVLSTLSGIENIQSVSSPGTSVVVTQFAWELTWIRLW